MINFKLAMAIFITSILGACSNDNAEKALIKKPRRPIPVVGEFKTITYPINATEHVTMFDMPGYWEPIRCIVWVDNKTSTSHMRCSNDFAESSDLPANDVEK